MDGPDTRTVTSEWIHPRTPRRPTIVQPIAHFLSLGAIFLFASPLVGPLSNKEQIISLLFARYRTLALPDFLFWIRFTRPSIRSLYPPLSSTCRCILLVAISLGDHPSRIHCDSSCIGLIFERSVSSARTASFCFFKVCSYCFRQYTIVHFISILILALLEQLT